ncbi:MAG: O-antigen ligase family protein [Egibacteraceae bacterium]
MAGNLELIIALVIAAVLMVVLAEWVVKRAEIGVGLMLGCMLLGVALNDNVPGTIPSVSFGPAEIQVTDLAFGLVLGAAVARLARARRLNWAQWGLLLFGVLTLLSLVRGTGEFGPEASAAEFRGFMRFSAAALYLVSFPPTGWLRERIATLWLVATVPVMLVASLRWLATLTDLRIGVFGAEFDAAIRSLSGTHTFFLAHAFLLTVPLWEMRGKQARVLKCLSVVLLVFVLLLNRRTVWITLIVGVALIVIRNRKLRRPAVALAVAGAIAASGAFLAFSGEEGAGRGGTPIAQSATSTDTLSWRIDGWRVLLADGPDTPSEWIIGEPFGTGFARRIGGADFESQPHNLYLETLLRTGVLGAALLIGLFGATLLTFSRRPLDGSGLLSPGFFSPGVLMAMFVAQLIWFMAWAPGLEQGIITGLAASWAAANVRTRATPLAQDRREPSSPPATVQV